MSEQKLSKEALIAQRKQSRKEQIENDKREERISFENACKELALFIKDARYKGYRYLLATRLKAARERREALRNTTKTNDEYIRQGLMLDTEISVLKEIIEIPSLFAERLKELNEEPKKDNGGS